MKWRVIVKFNRPANHVMPSIRQHVMWLGLEMWWIPKLGY